MKIAIDTGGTFTDVILYDEENHITKSLKVSTNSNNPDFSFIEGIVQILKKNNMEVKYLSEIIYATTIATNSILEGKIAKIGLFVTKGFRDLLEIGRQTRPSLYNLMIDRLQPLVPRNRIREVTERIDCDGKVITPLNNSDAEKQVSSFNNDDIDSFAVVFLFSFLNSLHEEYIGNLIKKTFPDKFCFLSGQILPEFREYERASTTVIAAAVAPIISSYIKRINKELSNLGLVKDLLKIMHSGGGVLQPNEAITNPHMLVESGPAAGLIAAGNLAKKLEIQKCIAFDMGGTTAKAGLILDGKPNYTLEFEVGGPFHSAGYFNKTGYPLRFPIIDVAECGSGGGSIAWIDSGGHLKVGPKSSGANPGPACYGRGGEEPTVTDAYIVLNRLNMDSPLGNLIKLKPKLSINAIKTQIANKLGIKLEEAAQGIISIANANMLRILHLVSVARGYDPRNLTLIAYGGAGPLHALELSEKMNIKKVIIPKFAGLFSAMGLLFTDLKKDFVTTVMKSFELENFPLIKEKIGYLVNKAEEWFDINNISADQRVLTISGDLRYSRQNYELTVQFPSIKLKYDDLNTIQQEFHNVHKKTYGYASSSETVQIVNLRIMAIKRLKKPELDHFKNSKTSLKNALKGSRSVYFSEGQLNTKIYDRNLLGQGNFIEGPAIIEENESTTLVGSGMEAKVDKFGNLIIKKAY
ncbi:MAG: hydantoinase/oxoprolinase family protein [Promethearchaeota archaeon]|nr:MAG: hydantoinase/oxoprolinase family protein [Candidatus Lokiarchaeota archaeon]